jgi:hypothetical protein
MKALIKTVLVTCLMLGGAAAAQTASAGDVMIRIGTGGGYHGMHHGHRAMPRVAHPRVAYVRPAPPRVVHVRPAHPRIVYVRPALPRYVRPMPPRWRGHHGGYGHHGGHGGCARC